MFEFNLIKNLTLIDLGGVRTSVNTDKSKKVLQLPRKASKIMIPDFKKLGDKPNGKI